MVESTTLFAEYACGNRYYFAEGQSAPEECPTDECAAEKCGVFRDV